MAKLNASDTGTFKDWQDGSGNIMHASDYKQERLAIITGHNDLEDTVTANKTDADSKNTAMGTRMTTAEGNISNLQPRMTTAESNITNNGVNLTTHKSSGDHDGRYYTETEVDSKLSSKTDLTGDHAGTWHGLLPSQANESIASQVLDNTNKIGNLSDKLNQVSINVKNYGASGSGQTTTGTINSGSNQLTLSSAIDFVNGQGIIINHAGATCTLSTPTAPTITATGTIGTTAYQYQIVAMDANGGFTAASTVTSITNGNATLSITNYNAISWSTVTNASAYAVYGRVNGNMNLLAVTNSNSFNDTGHTSISVVTIPFFLPLTPPTTAKSDWLVTTISSGAGTTTLTLAANATTTGSSVYVAHDDTAALQNAINAMKTSTVKTLFVPAGQYSITSSLYIRNMPPIRLKGDFGRQSIIKNSTDYTYTPGSSVIINNSNGAAIVYDYQNASAVIGDSFRNENHNVEHLGILNTNSANGIGIEYTGSVGNTNYQHHLDYVVIQGGKYALHIANWLFDMRITNFYFTWQTSDAFHFDRDPETSFPDPIMLFLQNGTVRFGNGWAIWAGAIEQLYVDGCLFEANTGGGVYVEGVSKVKFFNTHWENNSPNQDGAAAAVGYYDVHIKNRDDYLTFVDSVSFYGCTINQCSTQNILIENAISVTIDDTYCNEFVSDTSAITSTFKLRHDAGKPDGVLNVRNSTIPFGFDLSEFSGRKYFYGAPNTYKETTNDIIQDLYGREIVFRGVGSAGTSAYPIFRLRPPNTAGGSVAGTNARIVLTTNNSGTDRDVGAIDLKDDGSNGGTLSFLTRTGANGTLTEQMTLDFAGLLTLKGTGGIAGLPQGTFTPSLQSSTGGHIATHTNQQGSYIKVGKMVTFRASITISSLNTIIGTDALVITGLPFVASAETPLSIGYHTGITATISALYSTVAGSSTSINIFKVSYPGNTTAITGADIASNFTIQIAGSYISTT